MRAFLAAAVLVGAFGLSAFADENQPDDKKPVEKKKDPVKPNDQDWRISYVTWSTVQFGVKLWDDQNYEGCFRLYQGYLVGVVEALEHRPNLAGRVREAMQATATLDAVNGAMELRKVLDTIQLETSGRPSAALNVKKTLWDRLGGEKGARTIVKDFLGEVRKDPKIDLTRGGTYKFDDKDFEAIEQGLVELLSMNSGGPKDLVYNGPRITMLVIGTKITDAEFSALYINLYKATIKNNVSDDDRRDLMEILSNYKSTIVGK
jgi:truncated hemoglobin YjbI